MSEDEAARVALASKDDMTYELWVVPGRGGDQCIYVRVIRAGVDMENGGAARCDFDEPPPLAIFPPGLPDGTRVLSIRATTAHGETVAVEFMAMAAPRSPR